MYTTKNLLHKYINTPLTVFENRCTIIIHLSHFRLHNIAKIRLWFCIKLLRITKNSPPIARSMFSRNDHLAMSAFYKVKTFTLGLSRSLVRMKMKPPPSFSRKCLIFTCISWSNLPVFLLPTCLQSVGTIFVQGTTINFTVDHKPVKLT